MAAIGLWLLGVLYFFVLGIWMAVTAILPYIGAFLGGIPAVIIALTISWQLAVVTIVLYVVINQVEGNLITPRIQGNAVQGQSGHDLHRGAAGQRAGRHPRRDHRRADAGDRTRAGRHRRRQSGRFPPILSGTETPPQESGDTGSTARGTASRDTTGR